jgi:hypothetical protein
MSCQRSGTSHIQQVQDQLAGKGVENPALQLRRHGINLVDVPLADLWIIFLRNARLSPVYRARQTLAVS